MEFRPATPARNGRSGSLTSAGEAPPPRSRAPSLRDTRGAVYVEFLVAFLPFFSFFLCLWQASIVYYTKLLVDHAAFAAARAAAVIVAENPNRVDPQGGPTSVNKLTASRADYVRIAAELALAPSIMDGTIVLLDVKFPPGDKPGAAEQSRHPEPKYADMTGKPIRLMRVRIETWMVCKIGLANAIMCPPNTVLAFFARHAFGTFVLPVRSEAVFPYQGASYEYKSDDDKGGKAANDAVASQFGSMCFAAGTLVDTGGGGRPIEQVRTGDLVSSRDEATGEVRSERVVRTFVTPDQPLVEVRLRDSGRIRATPGHPFGTADRGWVAAQDLAPGEAVSTAGGQFAQVDGVTPLDARATVYNLEVEHTHTYFVGRAEVLVHNNCDTAIPGGGTFPGLGSGGGGPGGGGGGGGGPGAGGGGPGGGGNGSGASSSGASSGVPQNALDVLAKISANGGSAPPGYVSGPFQNDGRGGGQVLDKTDGNGNPITYTEYDVNPRVSGVNRGSERIVIGSDGRAYYTNDHYTTFTPI